MIKFLTIAILTTLFALALSFIPVPVTACSDTGIFNPGIWSFGNKETAQYCYHMTKPLGNILSNNPYVIVGIAAYDYPIAYSWELFAALVLLCISFVPSFALSRINWKSIVRK
jgi:hypothetical protein